MLVATAPVVSVGEKRASNLPRAKKLSNPLTVTPFSIQWKCRPLRCRSVRACSVEAVATTAALLGGKTSAISTHILNCVSILNFST